MKIIIISLLSLFAFSFNSPSDCGDGKVYANEKQTSLDKRFNNYEKIEDVPKYKGGDKKLKKYITSKLKLNDAAKNSIFNLNYQFTVTCDGKIKDVKQIGDPKADEWTNIVEIIESSEVNWTPAQKDGKPVDCVYFGTLFINGSAYQD